jgi:hypothetical protein
MQIRLILLRQQGWFSEERSKNLEFLIFFYNREGKKYDDIYRLFMVDR